MAIITRSVHNPRNIPCPLRIPGYDATQPLITVAPSATLDLLSVITEDNLIAAQNTLDILVAGGALTVVSTFDTSSLEQGYDGGGVTFPLLAPDGTTGAPSYSFASLSDVGMWLNFGNNLALTLDGHSGGSNGGDIRLTSGDGSSSDGSVYLTAGHQSGFGGSVAVFTGNTERLRIGSHGAWKLGGSTAGNFGDVLTSSGSGNPPTWTAPSLVAKFLETGTSEPGSPVVGQLFFNTITHQAEVWNGTSWSVMG